MTGRRVMIAGAGPVGMICALALVKRDVPVLVIERESSPPRDHRAATIQPSTLELLDELGLAQKILPLGLQESRMRYHDRCSGDLIAEFDFKVLEDEVRHPFVLQYEQWKLVTSVFQELKDEDRFEIRFASTAIALTQDERRVAVTVRNQESSEEILHGDYLVGCDGAQSFVRTALGIPFEGYTYPEKFIKLATPFDFSEAGYDVTRNYFADPHEWMMLFKVMHLGPPGLWRCIFPTRLGESDDDCLQPDNMQRRLNGFVANPDPYDISEFAVYHVHQRVAARFRKDRVLLAGDAAHVHNPIGGLGMNAGIHDAMNVADKLARVLTDGESMDNLELYARERHLAQTEFSQEHTARNKKLLEQRDPEARRAQFDHLRKTAADLEAHKAFLRKAGLIDVIRQQPADRA